MKGKQLQGTTQRELSMRFVIFFFSAKLFLLSAYTKDFLYSYLTDFISYVISDIRHHICYFLYFYEYNTSVINDKWKAMTRCNTAWTFNEICNFLCWTIKRNIFIYILHLESSSIPCLSEQKVYQNMNFQSD
jgi:hypothetical protein